MEISEFVRLYPLRSPNMQWFFGAGASTVAGIKTVHDVIWDLKRARLWYLRTGSRTSRRSVMIAHSLWPSGAPPSRKACRTR